MEKVFVNVFDFDKTIYSKDSEEQFIKFLLRRKPYLYLYIPYFTYGFIKYKLGFCNEQRMKEYYYKVILHFKDIESMVELFWDKEEKNIFPYFYKIHKEDDIVISATNYLILDPICRRLKINCLITGDIDLNTARFKIPDCKGKEKVRRLKKERPEVEINDFYSDSYNDEPLAEIARNAYMVKSDGTYNHWIFHK